MTTLSANLQRKYHLSSPDDVADCSTDASAHIYEGMALSYADGTGTVHTLATGEKFAGFAWRECDNTIAPTNKTCLVKRKGVVALTIVGTMAASAASRGKTVYATDGNTFTDSSAGSAPKIGVVVDYDASGVWLVEIRSDLNYQGS